MRYQFIEDYDGFILVYIGGAYFNYGKPNAAAGLGVWYNHDHMLYV